MLLSVCTHPRHSSKISTQRNPESLITYNFSCRSETASPKFQKGERTWISQSGLSVVSMRNHYANLKPQTSRHRTGVVMFHPMSLLTRIFAAESNPFSSQLLAEALARKSSIEVLGFSSDPLEEVRILGSCSVDVLLVSARMDEEPNRSLSVLQGLRVEGLGVKAIALLDSSRADM